MTDRNKALHAELAARRVQERRRRATTRHELDPTASSALLWWLCGLSIAVAALALFS